MEIKEEMRTVQRKIKTKMQECEAAYRDETESHSKKDTESLAGFTDYYRIETQRTIYLIY